MIWHLITIKSLYAIKPKNLTRLVIPIIAPSIGQIELLNLQWIMTNALELICHKTSTKQSKCLNLKFNHAYQSRN